MKIQFDSTQEYQLQAISAVTDIFEGQPLKGGDFETAFSMAGASIAFSEKGVGNNLLLTNAQLLKNVQAIQERAGLSVSEALEPCCFAKDTETGEAGEIPLNFTVEMETGTGKTYTYLRTIYELNKLYGFKKFVIVVPSVAIREGTIKNLQITHEHFQSLYDRPPVNFVVYDSKNLSTLRDFAISDMVQILVINIDSFTKDSNVINTKRESGIKPIEYIQGTNPIVIVDEPQNMETSVRKQALFNLNPLCTLRYSATHKNLYNLVYNLNPVQAYDLGLVKQIEVDGVTADNNYNAAFIQFKGITPGKRTIKVKLGIYANDKGGVKAKDVNCEVGSDLYVLSGNREIYKDGFSITNVNAQDGEIEFANGLVIREGQAQGGLTDEVMKYQMKRTITAHFEKVKKLQPKGIKVLSLFFIDRVASYREYDENGVAFSGKFALWFEELYREIAASPRFAGLIPFDVAEVHNGYFSQDKKGVFKDSNGSTKADEDIYSLIMQRKEELLSLETPLQFIFSHSALREGWDNPNVFQICTLNERKSDMTKRQEIGRGLRLPVNSKGRRIMDKSINVLTVIANETYEDFAQSLQTEIETETGVSFSGKVKNARDKATVKRNKELTIENFPLLYEIWQKISQKTKYSVAYEADDLIAGVLAELADPNKVPPTKRPMLEARRARLAYTEEGIEGELKDIGREYAGTVRYQIPDVYGYIQSRIDITRPTIFRILKESGRYSELEINPQMFLDNLIGAIGRTINALMVSGIKYTPIDGQRYEMALLETEEIETYLSEVLAVKKPEKTVYNYYRVDSDPERVFAQHCEADPKVQFFFKLPGAFKIPTPIGNYNPDWAVLFENDKRIYFVVETKGTTDHQKLRPLESMKIKCGTEHFALMSSEGVAYKLAVKAEDLY